MTAPKDLQAGDLAPGFALPNHTGTVHKLSDFAGRAVVLFFYPRADTPGCTTEAQDFSQRVAAFDALKSAIVGISADPPRKLARFRERRELNLMLLSDETQTVLRAYGVWGEKTMYGKVFDGIMRTTVLIGPDGRIVEIWRGVKVLGHAQVVLTYVQDRS